MKKKMVKGLLTLSLVGALALSGVPSAGTGLNAVEAAKIVAKTDLSAVTGIGYNAKDKQIYWNKVPNATKYYISVTDMRGNEVHWDYEYIPRDDVSLSAGTYNVSIKAVDTSGAYVAAADVKGYNPPEGWSWDTGFSESKEIDGRSYYTFYQYPSSTGTGQIVVEDTSRKVVRNAVTAMPAIQVKEVQENYWVVEPTTPVALNVNERIYWEFANNDKFISNRAKDLYVYTDSTWDGTTEQKGEVRLSNFMPGETIYARARVYNPYCDDSVSNYSAYSNTISYTVKKAKISYVSTTADTDSVTLDVNTTAGSVTGYQFAKKVGSGWVTLDTQTDPCYVDTGLAKNTKYQYRVRAYTYNKTLNKTVWTDWYTVDTTTWGSNLNVKAAAQSATSVKLTWKPVSGAEGYEVYRYDTDSYARTYEKGVALEAFDSMYLVKTFKGSKAKSYTDKKLSKNASYEYIVRAYRTIGKQKIYLQGYASASLRAGSMNLSSYKTADGKVVATWNKQTGLKGYYVEKYDRTTETYTKVATLKPSATSYTFAKVNPGCQSEKYRIRPYDATAVYDASGTVTVSASLAAPTGVTVKRTETGVQVTWKPVAGADYYVVNRTTDGSYTYNKTTKTYNYFGGNVVYEGAVNTENCKPELGESGYKNAGTYATTEIRGTTVEDKPLAYMTRSEDENGEYIKVGTTASGQTVYQTEETFYYGVEGPEAGTTYYYYVTAYADAPNGLNGESVWSAPSKAAKITFTNAVAKKVSKITAVKSSKKGQATISYKKVKGVDGYAIYRSTKKNGTYVLVGTSTKTSFTDGSAPSGKTCYYKVASYVRGEKKANIYSAKTAPKSVKVK